MRESRPGGEGVSLKSRQLGLPERTAGRNLASGALLQQEGRIERGQHAGDVF